MNKSKEPVFSFSLPRTSAADLRGKQSVRATFKLTEKAIGALNIVSVHLGVKQKSLFDHLMEDAETLGVIARSVQTEEFKKRECVQKTYVLSRKTLSSLDRAAKSFNAPRDALVEYSIQRLLPVIVREKEKHFKRKAVLSDMVDHLKDGIELLNKIRDSLGEDDPVYAQMESAIKAMGNACENVDTFVQRGKVIEEF